MVMQSYPDTKNCVPEDKANGRVHSQDVSDNTVIHSLGVLFLNSIGRLLLLESSVNSVLHGRSPQDTDLICHGVKLSLLHLKSLNFEINENAKTAFEQVDPKFVQGWIYDEVVNAFLKSLEVSNDKLFACDTTVALGLCKGSYYKSLYSKLVRKDIILFPANTAGNHWTIVAVDVKRCKVWYYNPLSCPGTNVAPLERKLIETVVAAMNICFPAIKAWSIHCHYDLQTDLCSCGIYICWFSFHISVTDGCIPRLLDPCSFRKSIYNILCLNCLKRNLFTDNSCGICKKVDTSGLKAWAKCCRCDQFFHTSCISS